MAVERDHALATIGRLCRKGLATDDLWAAVLPALRRTLRIDALWAASVDPTTLLFTQDRRLEIPRTTGPYFVENELLRDDVNKWTELARDPAGVRTLVDVTRGAPSSSARYRDVFAPLGLEDELRAVLRSRGATWGCVCLHREPGRAFSRDEVAFVRAAAPLIGDGLRVANLVASVDTAAGAGSALFVLGPDDSVIATSSAADAWRDQLGDVELPVAVHAVAGALRRGDASPSVRVRTAAGQWALVEASRLDGPVRDSIAVIVRPASADEMAPLVMRAYGLTDQERAVSGHVLRGCSTREIADALRISEHTVQDHIKSIFDKTGVRSRRELVASVLRRHYLKK